MTIYISDDEKAYLKTLASEQGTAVIDIGQWVLDAGGAGISGPLLVDTDKICRPDAPPLVIEGSHDPEHVYG